MLEVTKACVQIPHGGALDWGEWSDDLKVVHERNKINMDIL